MGQTFLSESRDYFINNIVAVEESGLSYQIISGHRCGVSDTILCDIIEFSSILIEIDRQIFSTRMVVCHWLIVVASLWLIKYFRTSINAAGRSEH